MDIRGFLEIGTSRLNADILVDKIEEDPDVFEIVWQNMLNIISMLPIPEEHCGNLFDHCYGLLVSPGTAIAIRAYAMSILYQISNHEPELKPELITLFESQKDSESAGVYARANILLKKLYKEIS